MADGAFRFHQPGAGQYYPTQHTSHRNQNRATSPSGARRPYTNDTPSPSRSPVGHSVAHNFNMYSQNGYQTQHSLMNGAQTHQRYANLHLPKYQPPHHGHHAVAQHHGQHHHAGQLGHQHNLSGGFQSGTPHLPTYAHEHLSNGNGNGLPHDDTDEPDNEYWREQKQFWEESKDLNGPNQRARTVAHHSKGVNYVPLGAAAEDLQTDNARTTTSNGQSSGRQTWDELDLGGQGLCALSPVLFNPSYHFLKRLDLVYNQLEALPPEIGQLKNLEHLDVSFNQLTELPEEIGMLTNLKQLLLFNNHIQTLCYELGFLYKLEMLGVYGNPLEQGQRDKITEGGTRKLIEYLRESMPEPPPPREREWHQIEEIDENDPTQDTIKVLNYNILCDRYATQQQYGYVPERVLTWGFRKTLILEEIREMNADIVCLQELDRCSYDDYFRGELSISGYKGYYAQKSRAETLGDAARFVDGCGTFWKDKKYMVLDTQHLVLGRKAVERPGAKASADMLNRVWQRDDIATVVFLENRVTGSRVVVVNAHIYWDPAFKDVKLIQAAVLMEELSKLTDKYAKFPPATNKQAFRFSDAEDDPLPDPGPSLSYTSGPQIPMIICGDFNSGAGSAVYDLFTKKGLNAEHADLDGRDYGAFSRAGMSHNFTLKSSYAAIDGEMPFTNYTPNFVDVLDYIWYSSNSLRVVGLLGAIDPEYLKRVPGFPNFHFPSDHIAIVAQFKVEKQRNAQKAVEADFGPSSKK
ncbi:hypothetical protein AYL99_02520 [Fonsecaea erecta]|uniref:CCR4-Not complex 3'-5'-exoribonuclease subunit Ccr4 n=1 Tax=Fonsecaea erecta TaxID=1367422 RepID=A0A178ZVM0_9EURO|nr:hypothetical protein AYL99_02520 [Fonsecaea erecta]OAP63293.1 hypothetical protein AYL99_02520 [Fonsecaea erecta]